MTIKSIIRITRWSHDSSPTEIKLVDLMQKEGLEPSRWACGPYEVFDAHEHAYEKVVMVVEGDITFGFMVDGKPVTLRAGDKLTLPAKMQHNAVAGADGVVCLEARR